MRNSAIYTISIATLAIASSASAFEYGDPWTGYGTQCQSVTKDKKGKTVTKDYWRIHAGTDLGSGAGAKKGAKVKVAANLYYHSTHTDSGGWKDHVIACDTLLKGKCANDKNTTYYDFLHVNATKGLKSGQSLKDVTIGTVADLGTNSHLHLSKRKGLLNLDLMYKGALPPSVCTQGKNGLPDFPENFVKPDTSVVKFE